MNYLYNPKLYWVFAQFVRACLLPIVSPVRLYDDIMKMESFERRWFLFLTTVAFLAIVSV